MSDAPVCDLHPDGDADVETASDRGLSIVESSEAGGWLISVSGELERATMLELIEACTPRLDESLIIDLGGLSFMDGGGHSSLVVIREMANAHGGTVTIRNACGQPARLIGLIADLEAAQAVSGLSVDQQPTSDDLETAVDEEVERRYSDLLAEFAQTMTDFSVPAILDHLVERIVEVLPIDGAGVTLIPSGRDSQCVTASDDAALEYERIQNELDQSPGTVASTDGSMISVSDLPHDDRFPDFARLALAGGLGAVFSFPLRHEGHRLGALDLYRSSPGALGPRQLAVAQTFANVAAAYLVNARARADLVARTQQANHIALHDPLTGLPNRALLFERLVAALNRCRRTGSLVAVMYVDLDTFKTVNDTFGHRIGDEVLVLVAQRLTALLRPGDTVARLGGDEFAVVCDDIADASQLGPIADRLIDAFRLPFNVSSGPVEVRASIGIGIGDPTSTAEHILDEADAAMYQVKRRGGGRHAPLDPKRP